VDSTSPVTVTGLSGVASLATNLSASTGYAVKTDGTVWAWGYNHEGTIGDNTTANRATPVQVPGVTNALSVSPGLDAAYVPTASGVLLEWGSGSSGALATGNELNQLLPIAAPGVSAAVGASGGEATGYAIVAG
jgi:alpha-tubulin suppressor-like RCC1 family protein